MTTPRHRRIRAAVAATALAGTLTLAACSSGGDASTTTTAASGQQSSGADTGGSEKVLPVSTNPIDNNATADTLHIDSVLVENNEDANGKAVDDHLEIAVSNTGSTDLSGFEVYYTITDPTAGSSESYYTALPPDFSVPAGGTRTIHFDNTGATDHFAENPYSLYHSSMNELDVEVEVSAQGAAPQTATVKKDAGGEEVPD